MMIRLTHSDQRYMYQIVGDDGLSLIDQPFAPGLPGFQTMTRDEAISYASRDFEILVGRAPQSDEIVEPA